jgi:hypothetical protein
LARLVHFLFVGFCFTAPVTQLGFQLGGVLSLLTAVELHAKLIRGIQTRGSSIERHISTVDRYHVSSPQCLLADPRAEEMSQGRKVNRSIATMVMLRGTIVV